VSGTPDSFNAHLPKGKWATGEKARLKSFAQALVRVLRQQDALESALLEALREQHEALVWNDLSRLQAATETLERLGEKLVLIERLRRERVDQCAQLLGCEPGSLTVSTLVPHLDEEEAAQLRAVQASLRAKVQRVDELNGRLQRVLETALRMLQERAVFIARSLEEKLPGYTGRGVAMQQRVGERVGLAMWMA
jgi:Mg2+ and Co2+ transporter CorA